MQLPDFLTQDPDGEIHFTGLRLGIYTFFRCHREKGWSPEKIAEEYPSLSLDIIDKTLAFYRKHPSAVDAYLEAYQTELERQEAAYVPSPEQLKVRQWAEEYMRNHPELPDDTL